MQVTRRTFLAGMGSAALTPLSLARTSGPVRFGVISDVHHGLAERTESRLTEFLTEASGRPLDFIMQLGDFCHPVPEASSFLRLWNGYRGARHGVLGNHDMDLGSKRQILDLWQLRERFYSFDAGFLHFVVLDANHMKLDGKLVPYEKGNWYRSGITASWIDPEQIEWLRSDLAATRRPTVVFCHQELDETMPGGVPNKAEVRRFFEESGRVAACFVGHSHVDRDEVRNGIYYQRVNSSSYAWVGENYGRMAHYGRTLFAFVTIWPDGRLEVEGRRGFFEGDSPFARGVPEPDRFSANLRGRSAQLQIDRLHRLIDLQKRSFDL